MVNPADRDETIDLDQCRRVRVGQMRPGLKSVTLLRRNPRQAKDLNLDSRITSQAYELSHMLTSTIRDRQRDRQLRALPEVADGMTNDQ
jgi:hypothetical protein